MQPLMAPRAILWDWDNTLVDAWGGVQAGMNAALAAFDLPSWSVDEVRARARLSLRDSFPSIFGTEWERARDVFYTAVRQHHLMGLTPMPGTKMALEAASVWPQAVVSNKQGAILRAEVGHLGWAGRFGAVVGAGDARADKPSPEPLFFALDKMGLQAGPDVWFIGDTGVDIQAARAAGCSAILLGDAIHDGGVSALAPDRAFSDAEALANCLRSLAKPPPLA